MLRETPDAFLRRLLTKLTHAAKIAVLPNIPSRVLRDGLETVVEDGGFGYLYIPHYWALYIHDGHRGPIRPYRAQYLVWFRDPRDDPRLRDGYPIRETDVKRLTKDEFYEAVEIQRQRDIAGLPAYVYIRKFRPASPPRQFFETNLSRFEARADRLVADTFDRFVKNNYAIRRTRRARLRI